MGLGHMRASWALKEIASPEIIIYGKEGIYCSEREAGFISAVRRLYYLFSKAAEIPVIGWLLFGALDSIMKFPELYSGKKQLSPTIGVRMLDFIIRKKDMCGNIASLAADDPEMPLIHSFYATAIACALKCKGNENWLIVTDIDINRIWVSRNPVSGGVRYLVPSERTKRRLIKYGVDKQNISVTGFPLPLENIGSKENHEILSSDLAARIVRLDRAGSFRKMYGKICLEVLGLDRFPENSGPVNITYAIGGSGVQAQNAVRIVKSLYEPVKHGDFSITISCGINEKLKSELIGLIEKNNCKDILNHGLEMIASDDFGTYYKLFNSALRKTDILWTKPSELSFYCALGIPVVTSQPVGHHERMNRRWLREIHAAVRAPGNLDECSEWLYDLLETDIPAQTAWNGFLNAEKMGVYNILDKVFKKDQG